MLPLGKGASQAFLWVQADLGQEPKPAFPQVGPWTLCLSAQTHNAPLYFEASICCPRHSILPRIPTRAMDITKLAAFLRKTYTPALFLFLYISSLREMSASAGWLLYCLQNCLDLQRMYFNWQNAYCCLRFGLEGWISALVHRVGAG